MNLPRAITAEQRTTARSCSVACLIFAIVLIASFLFSAWSEVWLISPVIFLGMYLLAFPLALICTVVAIRAVGFLQCKIAWVSFSVFLAPILVWIVR